MQDDSTKVPEESDTYLQFDLVLSDVSAFMIDGDYNWSHPKDSRLVSLLPVVDKCGIIVKLQQVWFHGSLNCSSDLDVCISFF